MTIYEIESSILECIDEETGEILDVERLEQLMQDKQDKIESVACWYKNKVAEAEAIKAEAKKLSERAKSAERTAESLKIYLSNVLDGEKFKTARVAVSFRSSEIVEVDDVYKLPDNFVNTKIEMSPKKTEIKQAIKNGAVFEGVRLVKNRNIQIK